jgi:RNA recognition motif-containing protein
MNNRLYVGNLAFHTTEDSLLRAFSQYGEVVETKVVLDRETGRSRGFGFVEMRDDNQGRAACEALDQREFEGRRLTVNEAKPQERRDGFSRGDRGSRPGGNRQRQERW